MDKSAHRNQRKSRRGSHHQNPMTFTDLMTDAKQKQPFLAEVTKAIPNIKKFSRKNWKQIALFSAGLTILAGGVYLYSNQQKRSPSQSLHH